MKLPLSKQRRLLDIDIDDAIESLAPTWEPEELEAWDPERFIALLAMTFQIGGFGVQRKFPSFVKAVQDEDWDRAADEMMWSNGLKKQRRSTWWKQTSERCEEMADRMRTGHSRNISQLNNDPEQVDTPLAGMTDQELLNQLNRDNTRTCETLRHLTKRRTPFLSMSHSLNLLLSEMRQNMCEYDTTTMNGVGIYEPDANARHRGQESYPPDATTGETPSD